MPKVSVIVPNYNHAAFLGLRIDSILEQTYRDFELLILDDASTDDSREVIARYARDPRVTIECNQTNAGSPYLQWRKGLAMTSGAYVWIAESDDFAAPTMLGRLVDLLDRHPRVGIAACDSWMVDETGGRIQPYSDTWRHLPSFADLDLSFLDHDLVMDGRTYNRRYMHPWNTIPNASAAVFRRAAFDAIGGPVIDMRLCGDWLTYCKMLMHFDMARVHEPLNSFRHHAVSVRTQTKAKDFVRESMRVQAFVADALSLDKSDRHPSEHVLDFFSHALMASQRSAVTGKVPWRRFAPVMRDAADFGGAIFFRTLRTLAREQAALVARRLGLHR